MWFLGIVGLVVLWLAIVYPGFRKALLVGIATIAVGGFAYYKYDENAEKERDRIAFSKIAPSQLRLSDMGVEHSGSIVTITGTVHNASDHELSAMWFRLEALDCPSPTAKDVECLSIGLEPEAYAGVMVPPHSSRSFEALGTLYNMAPHKGFFRQVYSVAKVRASD